MHRWTSIDAIVYRKKMENLLEEKVRLQNFANTLNHNCDIPLWQCPNFYIQSKSPQFSCHLSPVICHLSLVTSPVPRSCGRGQQLRLRMCPEGGKERWSRGCDSPCQGAGGGPGPGPGGEGKVEQEDTEEYIDPIPEPLPWGTADLGRRNIKIVLYFCTGYNSLLACVFQ